MKGLTLLLGLMLSTLAFSGERDILVIESYHQEYPWDASYLEGIRQTLGKDYQIHTFEMDTKRRPKSEYQAAADAAWAHYQKLKPRLVILGDDNALNYLAPRFRETDTPVVYLGINGNPAKVIQEGDKNFTGVLERPLFEKAVLHVRKLIKPRPKNVLILFDSGKTSETAVNEFFKGQNSLTIGPVDADVRMIGNLSDWKDTVSGAKGRGYDAVILGLYHTLVDDSGKHVSAQDVLDWTAANTPLPLFAFWDFAVGPGKAVGGLVLFGKEQGILAGRLADLILHGAQPSSLKPVTANTGRYLYSQSELKRWKLEVPTFIRYQTDFVN